MFIVVDMGSGFYNTYLNRKTSGGYLPTDPDGLSKWSKYPFFACE
jgi:hypothetical protein